MLSESQIKDDDWKERLNEKFGWMFGGYGLFEISNGRQFLLEDLLKRIDMSLPKADREGFYISDVKSKWAELRVYHNGPSSVDRLVDEAESMSEISCETCGGRGRKVNVRGWVTVRCARHVDWRG